MSAFFLIKKKKELENFVHIRKTNLKLRCVFLYFKKFMSIQNTNSKPIGVFDSGIGGLTVVKSLIEQLPNENIIYFGDTARVPYGPKSTQVIRDYAAQDTDFLLSQNVKMIVVACNTVSSVALDIVQKKSKLPVVGVIQPSAKCAVASSNNKRIGVIGTLSTILSKTYENTIRYLDPEIKIISKACPLFVPLTEEGFIDHPATELIANEYLFDLKLEKIDTLILGCTHYPILSKVIGKIMGTNVQLIDSGKCATEEVKKILQEKDLKNPSRMKANVQYFVSDIPHKFTEIGERFLGRKMGKVKTVRL